MTARKTAPHAHASEDKEARRGDILRAAAALFRAGDGSLPTVAHIAAASGLAKGTAYLYFRTKEEIFAALLLEDWGVVMDEAQVVFRATGGKRGNKVRAFLMSLVAHLDRHPEVLRLDALGYAVLEKNMERDVLRAHKSELGTRLVRTGAVIDGALRLPEGRGVQLLMRTYALTRGMWQSYEHAEQTELAGIAVVAGLKPGVFREELMEALTEYWRGALG